MNRKKFIIPKLPSDSFCWLRWLAGNPVEVFGQSIRSDSLPKETIREKAVGYCDGESLVCRPKENYKGVLFLNNGHFCWFHLKNEEFYRCFEQIP